MRLRNLLTVTLIAAAGCTHAPPPPVAIVALPPEPAPRPAPPGDLPQTMRVPARLADGRYATINRDLSSAGSVWHLRSALNVAALGCRGPEEATMVARYNGLLRAHKVALASADKAFQAEFKARDPLIWQSAHDEHLTRVYNFFAQPLNPAAFCKEALSVAGGLDIVTDAELPAFATAAVERLEAPFTDAYARYDAYQTRLAAWQAEQLPGGPRLTYAALGDVIAWSPAATPIRTAALR